MSFSGHFHSRTVHRRRDRSGFTLIELLIAITIMLILFSMTAGIVSLAINTDRIPSSARTIQAALLGARDRAVRAGRADLNQQPRRGIRFVASPTQPNAIGSLVYIGSQDDWTDEQLTFTSTTDFTPPTSWTSTLAGQNLANARIKIPDATTGAWYRLLDGNSITRPWPGALSSFTYRLQLPSSVLPNEQPLTLDGNVVINLDISADHGVIPSSWYVRNNNGEMSPNPPVASVGPYTYSYPPSVQSAMEILFSPNGNVVGPLSAQGPIYLYLCTRDDFLAERVSPSGCRSLPQGRDPADPARGEALILKINTQNGRIQTFPVDPTDAYVNATLPRYSTISDYSGPPNMTPDGLADNPFRFAQQQ